MAEMSLSDECDSGEFAAFLFFSTGKNLIYRSMYITGNVKICLVSLMFLTLLQCSLCLSLLLNLMLKQIFTTTFFVPCIFNVLFNLGAGK
jgi:hypothetical protein